MCQTWLKFVAPWVASATEVQGRFSLDLDSAEIPLRHPKSGSATGAIEIHEARVGPSPLSRELLLIASQIKALSEGRPLGSQPSPAREWMVLPAHRAEFRLADGRVHHRQLQFRVGDVVVYTTGSVGLDETLSMVATAPVREAWASRNRLLASFQGQVLQIPIRGTLTRPVVDRRVMLNIGEQMLRGAAEKLLEDEVNRRLQRLFGNP